MLRNLHIKNLALIREVDVDFAEGLNILTGETGAGKSIIIDSVGLALGGRAARDMVRDNGAPALAELVFEPDSEEAVQALRSLGIDTEDGIVLVSRRFQDGRSTIRINGETKTAAEARECGACLLDIHGQSEHQKLLRQDRQLELLDEYGGKEVLTAKERVRADWKEWSELRAELEKGEMSDEDRARRISFLEFEVGEIDDAALAPGEDEEVEQRYRRLSNTRKIQETLEEVREAAGYGGPAGAGDRIGSAVKRLESIAGFDERLRGLSAQLGEIDDLLNDFNRDLADYAGDLTFEAGTFEETEERLNLINRLKKKYGRTVGDVLEGREQRMRELESLRDYEEARERLGKRFAEAEKRLGASTAALTSLRKQYAAVFTEEAMKQFSELNFARADFAIEWKELPDYTANGRDGVDFCIATNPGEERRPLRQVVSGGELSRLMLGIRTMFADSDSAGTIIFDEVDAGISGRTAQKEAEKMAQVAKRHQVICITHLPQIAAMADTHYGITKDVSDETAITSISALDDEESAREIARLIGGARITGNTMNSAREMKEMCRQFKAREL